MAGKKRKSSAEYRVTTCGLCEFPRLRCTRFDYRGVSGLEEPEAWWLCHVCLRSPVSFALYDGPEARVLKAIGWATNAILHALSRKR